MYEIAKFHWNKLMSLLNIFQLFKDITQTISFVIDRHIGFPSPTLPLNLVLTNRPTGY